jgi:hypothetical protein
MTACNCNNPTRGKAGGRLNFVLRIAAAVGLLALALAGLNQLEAAQPFEKPIVPADPDAAGRELVARLLALKPDENATNEAVLHVRLNRTNEWDVPLRVEVRVSETNWTTTYLANPSNSADQTCFTVVRTGQRAAEYHLRRDLGDSVQQSSPTGPGLMVPFAGSDFWLADLGMDFLQWPTQRLVLKEVRRTQSCDKLESLAPPGWTNGYVRVVSWFAIDSGAPVLIEAYDARGRMLKEFKPNEVRKVNGQWRAEELEMNNWRTGSRSSLRFLYDKR